MIFNTVFPVFVHYFLKPFPVTNTGSIKDSILHPKNNFMYDRTSFCLWNLFKNIFKILQVCLMQISYSIIPSIKFRKSKEKEYSW